MDTRDTRCNQSTAGGGARPPLPFERAFLVQLHGDAAVAGNMVSGRVEHLSSGVSATFVAVDELIAWMSDAIARHSVRAAK